ncbi:MAG TPA: helix-turn-helix domain-containing protein [Myxococcaceae bacterium]|nr:helix-turn-helix domain-containing protein [Myxococcaceae bacterium]
MTATEEPTLYDVLEVDPASSIDELREAVERARETYGTESLAVYALVDEDELGELRARLDEAAEVLLDPARRASYDRSIGRIGPATLWAEDDDEDAPPLPPIAPGPHARSEQLEDDDAAELDEEEEEPPRQHALALEMTEAPGLFGRTATAQAAPEDVSVPAERSAQPELLLNGDWAAAVPGDQAVRQAREPDVSPARQEPAASPPEDLPERLSALSERESDPERTVLAPALGLRIKPAPQLPPAEPMAAEPLPLPPAPPPASAAPERQPELPTRPRENKLKLDLPADAEFNGELLRQVRESYGLSLQQVAERTRITRIHLENVEADRYDRLPATVYLRGILVNLARELRLDPARVSKTYLLAAQRSHARGS